MPLGIGYDALRYMLLGMGYKGNMYEQSGKGMIERDMGHQVWNMKLKRTSHQVCGMML